MVEKASVGGISSKGQIAIGVMGLSLLAATTILYKFVFDGNSKEEEMSKRRQKLLKDLQVDKL